VARARGFGENIRFVFRRRTTENFSAFIGIW